MIIVFKIWHENKTKEYLSHVTKSHRALGNHLCFRSLRVGFVMQYLTFQYVRYV